MGMRKVPTEGLAMEQDKQGTGKPITLIQLMIPVVMIGILSAIAIPNCVKMQDRAKEGSTKAQMHTVQLAVEDYGVQFHGRYPIVVGVRGAGTPGGFADLLPRTLLKNSFTKHPTEPRLGPAPDSAEAGSVWYTPKLDSAGVPRGYLIEGFGREGKLTLALLSGE